MALGLVRFRRLPDGEIAVRLTPAERDVLRALFDDLAAAVAAGEPATARLRPPAYPDDDAREAEYRSLVGESLEEGRRRNLATVAGTLDAARLDDQQAAAWLGTMNDLRLVLGERLGITDDFGSTLPPEGDPRYAEHVQLLYLGWLEEQLVDALSRGLADL